MESVPSETPKQPQPNRPPEAPSDQLAPDAGQEVDAGLSGLGLAEPEPTPDNTNADQLLGQTPTAESQEQNTRLSNALGTLAVHSGGVIKTLVTVGARRGKELSVKAGKKSKESLSNTKDHSILAINALHKAHAITKKERLEQHQRSAEVRKEAARAMLVRNENGKMGRARTEGLHPASLRDQRHTNQTMKRQGEADRRRYGDQYRKGQVWGLELDKYGKFDRKAELKKLSAELAAGQITLTRYKHKRKAINNFAKNQDFIQTHSGHVPHSTVHQVAHGKDPANQLHETKTPKLTEMVARAEARAASFEVRAEATRESIRDRHKRRAAGKQQREEKRADKIHLDNVKHNRAQYGPQDINGYTWKHDGHQFKLVRNPYSNEFQIGEWDDGRLISQTLVDTDELVDRVDELGGAL